MKKLMIVAVLGLMFTLLSIGSANAWPGRGYYGRGGYRVYPRYEYRAPIPVVRYGYPYGYHPYYQPYYRHYYRRCR